MKKIVYLLLITGLLVVTLAACKSKETNEESASATDVEVNEEGFPIVDEKLELSMMAPGTGVAEWSDMPTLQVYAEMTNMEFEYITPPLNDFQTKLNLAFASGDIADIIYGAGSSNFTPAMEVDYGEQGVLVPLEDLIADHAPNLQKLLEERPDVKKSITTIDGHIYALPTVAEGPTSSWYRGPLWYNGKWLDALGVKELPKTTDEFYQLLKRFKTEDPNGNGKADEIPLLDVKMNSSRPWLLGAFGMKEWGIEEVDGKVRYTPITENYKEYLTFMNKLYEEELLDPETFSQSDEQKKAKGQENRIGVFPDYFSFFTTGESEEEAMNNPMFQPLTSSISNKAIIPRSPAIQRGTFAITSNNPSPEASIRWIDYFYSKEGYEFLNRGPEGYMWEWKDKEGGEKVDREVPEGFKSEEDYRGTITPDYGISTPTISGPIEGRALSEFDKFIATETNEKISPYAEVPYPLVYLSPEEQKKANTIEVDLQSYVEQMEAKFITGVESLSNWEEYIKTIENMQIEEYIEIYQDAYNRWSDS
ncbi:extracellular solute-binding protein [Virgibacillus sp. AGTR]|uniref:extracellular solute-binding protein n=1 Tax=Virgibacillus sp. AGTR TaxID=2812055 RepID=UPI0019656E54|nr:extracellular solute-binding protein [Virgibacillus sp. AGTR]MCC2248651.1 extracellular solute-binding protein [Virgibacillus sp. AGTR]QRZ18405.1 extracellular solute-binding protein [Virgibacillus sp. AGTR]